MPSIDDLLEVAGDLIDDHAEAGVGGCALPRVLMVKADTVVPAHREWFSPVACLVVRGEKAVRVGSKSHTFAAGSLVVSAVNLPITGRVATVPYRAVALRLRSELMADLILSTSAERERPNAGFGVQAADGNVLEAYVDLLRLLDGTEEDRRILGPGAERELLYRLLQTPLGSNVRQVALEGDTVHRVGPALSLIRSNLRDRVRVDDLAAECHLSRTAFFRSFRLATGLTPLQYQKRLRLQEGRRLLLAGGSTAAQVAQHLGYANPAHFHREYVRLFATTPGQDAKVMDSAGAGSQLTG